MSMASSGKIYRFQFRLLFVTAWLILACLSITCAEKTKNKKKAGKIGKDIRDYTDADVHRLLDQWDVREKLKCILTLCSCPSYEKILSNIIMNSLV